jgi:hypothetical protein
MLDSPWASPRGLAPPQPIDPSKSSLQILWLLPENTHLETKRSNEGKTESERGEALRAERAKTRTFLST